MTAPDLTPEDTRVLRKQGDWRTYLRGEMDRGNARRLAPAPKPARPTVPGRRPGAWPAGTRPPDRPPDVPPEKVARAVAEYRHWVAAGSPPGDHHCECQPCQLLPGSTE